MSKAGGYDYNFSEQFVNTPLDRYFCVICQHPSRDPRMSVCCGHVFCKSCIGEVKSPCPMCRDENFVTFPNKQLDREIKNLDIFCTNISRGCMWQGKLSNVDDHLGKHGDCQFEEVKCTNDCGKTIQRWYLILKPSVFNVKLPVSTVMIQENVSILRVNSIRSSVQDFLYLVPTIVRLKLFLVKI